MYPCLLVTLTDCSSAERFFFFMSVFRNAFVIVILTIASWLYCRHRRSASGRYPIRILQNVPRGFQHVGPPVIDRKLISAMAGELPVATIILLLEHIAISKCKFKFSASHAYHINIDASIRTSQRVQDQPQPGVDCHRCHEHGWHGLRCLPCYWFVLALRTEVQVRRPHTGCRYSHCHRRHRCSIRLDPCLLLHPELRAICRSYPCRRRLGGQSAPGV